MTQVYYEDVEPGLELTPAVHYPTSQQLVKFSAASGDWYQVHYDRDFAEANGLPGVIVHGWLSLSFVVKVVTDWMGEGGQMVKLEGGYKGMNLVHEELFCYARVVKKSADASEGRVRLELWMENPAGDRTVVGSAVVVLPRRGVT